MPTVPILMPQLGESIAEATVVRLGVSVGDAVRADQEIIEVETNKAVMSVTTLCNGTVSEIRAQEGVSYTVGSLLGLLDVTEEEVARTGVDTIEANEARRAAAQQAASPGDAEANLHFRIDDEEAYERRNRPGEKHDPEQCEDGGDRPRKQTIAQGRHQAYGSRRRRQGRFGRCADETRHVSAP